MPITLETLVKELVSEQPGRARALFRLGIDFCKDGKKSLSQACQERQLDTQQAVRSLAAEDQPRPEAADLPGQTLAGIAEHIEQTHHAFIRDEIPRLSAVVDRVADRHGDRHPQMLMVREVFRRLVEELQPHLFKEEQVLFPAMRRIEKGEQPCGACGSISNPIRAMEAEHAACEALLKRLRELTDNYTPGADACTGMRVLMHGLKDLDADLYRHMDKENKVLFPRALALESSAASR